MDQYNSNKKKITINNHKIPFIKNNGKRCFFFPESDNHQFFKVINLKNIVKKNKKQTVYQSISFNTQNCLHKKNMFCDLDYPGKSYRKDSIAQKSLNVYSPITGIIIKILKTSGLVAKGEPILVIDAMKMENKILSPTKGNLIINNIKEGMNLKSGDLLFTIENPRTKNKRNNS